jgi:hypothetical protein
MIAEDQVAFAQMARNRNSRKLLPNARVHRAKQLAFREQPQKTLFESPHQERAGVRLKGGYGLFGRFDRACCRHRPHPMELEYLARQAFPEHCALTNTTSNGLY